MSAALGVYVVTGFDAFAKVPVPEVVQLAQLAPPPNVPVRLATGDDEQTEMSAPALTVDAG